MTRRPKSRLPPKLPAAGPPARTDAADEPGGAPRRDRTAARGTRFGRDEVSSLARRLLNRTPAACLGMPPLAGLEAAHVAAALDDVYGWDGRGARARIDPARTLDAFEVAALRIAEVARDGGKIALATCRPASLLGLYLALGALADREGGEVLASTETASVGRRGRRVRWLERVAVVTEDGDVLGADDVAAAEEMLLVLPRPDLVVADRTFAGVALAGGLEVVAFADLDALALAVAAWLGRSVRVVPLDDRQAPSAYAPLLGVLDQAVGVGPGDAGTTGSLGT